MKSILTKCRHLLRKLLGGKKADLKDNLIECERFLRSVGAEIWADMIKKVLRRKRLDLYARKEVLSWFGGMGSFNDLMILKMNGHSVKERHERRINRKLRKLQSKIYLAVKSAAKE